MLLDLRLSQRNAFDLGRWAIEAFTHLIQSPLDRFGDEDARGVVVAELIDEGLLVAISRILDRLCGCIEEM